MTHGQPPNMRLKLSALLSKEALCCLMFETSAQLKRDSLGGSTRGGALRGLPTNPCHMTAPGRALVALTVLALSSAVAAAAQDDAARRGLWFGLGLGYGLASLSCDSCTHAPLSGWSLLLSVGVTPSPHLRAGVEGDFWANGVRKGELPTIEMWTVLLAYYPRVRGGPYIQAGVGLSHYGLEHGTGDLLEPVSHEPAYAAAMGWGYTLGAGWDGRVRVTYAHGNVGTLYGGGPGSAGWTQDVFLVELGGVLR